MRLKPRYNPEVNQWWMCDEGRYAYKAIDENRITQVQVRNGTGLRQASWDEALGVVANALHQLRASHQLDRVGVILSTYLTNEGLYVAKRLFQAFGVRNITVQGPSRPGSSDQFLIQADKSPNTRGAHALGLSFSSASLLEQAGRGELSVLYVFGHDLLEVYGALAVDEAIPTLRLLAFQGPHVNGSCRVAHVILPSAVYAEQDGTFTNCQGRVQRIHPAVAPLGEAKADWQILLELARRLDLTLDFSDASAIFNELAAQESAFAGLTYEQLGDQGALLRC